MASTNHRSEALMSPEKPKYKALEASSTGLPWHTGIVHTAKCANCSETNKAMFRRCSECARCMCDKCHNRYGFRHTCLEGQKNGPFPTYAQEAAVLKIWDAEAPTRGGHAEPKGHQDWVWKPTPKALEKLPGAYMVENKIFSDSNPLTADTEEVSEQEFSSPRAPGADLQSLSVMPAAPSSPITPKLKAVVPSSLTTETGKRKGSDIPNSRGSKKPRAPRAIEPSATANRPSRTALKKEEAKKTSGSGEQASRRAEIPAATNAEDSKKDLVSLQTRTYEIDVRNMDTLRITMHPGFSMGNPLAGVNFAISADAPISLPLQLVYQYHTHSIDQKLERNTVAVLQGESTNVAVKTAVTVGPDPGHTGPRLGTDIHNVFLRAITSNEVAGNAEAMSRPLVEEPRDDDDY